MSRKHHADRVDVLAEASLRLGAEPVEVSSASTLSLSFVELSSPAVGTFREHLAEEFDVLTRRVRQQREQADRLRLLANQLEEQTTRDEHLLEELAAVLGLSAQLRIEDLSPRLRGRRLQEVAVQILRSQWGIDREIHYKEWFDLVQAEGHRVGGKDPLATFLAQIHRAPGIERLGSRTGLYRLRAVA